MSSLDNKSNLLYKNTAQNISTTRAPYDKDQTLQVLSAALAHELITPLSGIKFGVEGLEKHLPQLIEGFKSAKKHGLIDKQNDIRENKIHLISTLCERLSAQVNHSLLFIDMALSNIRSQQINKENFKVVEVKMTIDKALMLYPFTNTEKNKIVWENKSHPNFTYWGDPDLTIHVLFNLMKNAIFYTHNCAKSKITITTECYKNHHELIITDTGAGIPAEILPNIFKPFYTNRASGSGVGLSFCKLIMDAYDGDIRCESKEGESTTFILQFPHTVNHHSNPGSAIIRDK